ncbi:hypothetical protein N6P31_01275 [Pectobacterium betavasculorum]|uniref:hypothetical protein n=1 Tax=Pectobacterium betavasculorum TaxID=55207 RepID=UPI00313B7832
MAELTKEQRAERKAQQLQEQQALEQAVITTAALPSNGVSGSQQLALTDDGDNDGDRETVLMVRSAPDHPGGPTEADVHPDDVYLWIDEGWVKDASGED